MVSFLTTHPGLIRLELTIAIGGSAWRSVERLQRLCKEMEPLQTVKVRDSAPIDLSVGNLGRTVLINDPHWKYGIKRAQDMARKPMTTFPQELSSDMRKSWRDGEKAGSTIGKV